VDAGGHHVKALGRNDLDTSELAKLLESWIVSEARCSIDLQHPSSTRSLEDRVAAVDEVDPRTLGGAFAAPGVATPSPYSIVCRYDFDGKDDEVWSARAV